MENLSQGRNCGGYTYVPEFVNSTFEVDFFDYYSTTPVGNFLAIQGALTEKFWTAQPNYIRVRCYNGKPDDSADARGDGGLFSFVYTEPLTLIMTDPCVTSVVNFWFSPFPDEIRVPMYSVREVEEFDGPVDSASQRYGILGEPRICERFLYEIWSEGKRELLSPNYLDMEVNY